MTDDLHLTAIERDLIRHEFMTRFDSATNVIEGFNIKRWATGPKKGQPKISGAVQGLIDRGLLTITDQGHWPKAVFTARGLQALKRMAAQPRALDPERYQLFLDQLARIPEA